jgi:hypothetical protein
MFLHVNLHEMTIEQLVEGILILRRTPDKLQVKANSPTGGTRAVHDLANGLVNNQMGAHLAFLSSAK